MRTCFLGSILVVLALLAISPGVHAQAQGGPGPAATKAMPDLSGSWEGTAWYP